MVLIENSKCIATCAACGAPEEVLVLHLGPLFEFPDGVLQDVLTVPQTPQSIPARPR